MDVTAALDNFQHKNGEEIYKGKVIFAITERGNQPRYAKAFVSKHVIKPVLHLLINHRFHQYYNDPKGFESYGGSMKDGVPYARVFRIQYTDRKQFRFSIDEGKGQRTTEGGYRMTERLTSVQTFLSYDEALRMAHELYDYIHQAELVAMMNGKPFYTIMAQNS